MNLLADLAPSTEELVQLLLERPGLRIERIVSWGHASPPGFWYEQDRGEWVTVLRGRARLEFDDGRETFELEPGSFVDLPAGCRHRVAWTDPDEPTIWLAIHYA